MKIYWASRHQLTEGQKRMLEDVFNPSPDEKLEVVEEKVTFTTSTGLVDYIKYRVDAPVVCVAGAVHYLFAFSEHCKFYIFERDRNKNFSSLFYVDGGDNTVTKVAGEIGFSIDRTRPLTTEEEQEEESS